MSAIEQVDSGGVLRKRVVSGMRPTGKLHIGHYFGALENWVRLQNAKTADGDPEYECFYFIADWHALTSDYADASAVAQNSIEIAIDYLAAGLDPEKVNIFLQSAVPEHAELHLLLSMVTPLGWLERVPTYKEAFENVKEKDLHTYGFLGYPCLQTADIVIYSKPGAALLVPVGEDQVSHVELSREIVRRFSSFYGLTLHSQLFEKENSYLLGKLCAQFGFWGADELIPKISDQRATLEGALRRRIQKSGWRNIIESYPSMKSLISDDKVLTEPDVMLTVTPRIPGLDGRKMSKSYGNAITLSESDEDIRSKTKVMKTDPARQRRTDPGNPEVCPVFDWHKLFSPGATQEWAAAGCRSAGIGCIECKKAMADNLIAWIGPVRERRMEYQNQPKRVLEVIDAGSKRARVSAQETMERVREAVFHWKEARQQVSQEPARMVEG